MKIFCGGAIQGASYRPERAHAHRLIIDALKENGCDVLSEHTTGEDVAATSKLLVKSIGPLPADRFEIIEYPSPETASVFIPEVMDKISQSSKTRD